MRKRVCLSQACISLCVHACDGNARIQSKLLNAQPPWVGFFKLFCALVGGKVDRSGRTYSE